MFAKFCEHLMGSPGNFSEILLICTKVYIGHTGEKNRLHYFAQADYYSAGTDCYFARADNYFARADYCSAQADY